MKNHWLKPKYHNGLPIVEYRAGEICNEEELFCGVEWKQGTGVVANIQFRKIDVWLPIESGRFVIGSDGCRLEWGKIKAIQNGDKYEGKCSSFVLDSQDRPRS